MNLRKKIKRMILAIVSLTLVAVVAYGTSAYFFSTHEFSKTFKSFKNVPSDNKAIEATKPISILLMGVDTGTHQRSSTWEGNSDSMIVMTINPKTKKTTMTSLERDIRTKLVGPEDNENNGSIAKLNAAYADGGAEMALMTINELLNIKIDYYVQINMQGLIDLVNAVGGITVTNNFDFPITIEEHEPEYTAKVEPGTHKINGEQALVYSRMRYDDPEGDYGRQKRQREVIQKIMQKVLSLNSVSSYRKILKAVSKNMQTNIEINSSTIPSLLGYTDALKHVKTYQLRGADAMIDGTSYQVATQQDILTVQNRIRKELGLEEVTELTTAAVVSDGDIDISDSVETSSSSYDSYSTPSVDYSESNYYSGDTTNNYSGGTNYSYSNNTADTYTGNNYSGAAANTYSDANTAVAPSAGTTQSVAQ